MKLTFFILNKVFGFRDYFVHCLKKNPKAQYFRTIGYQLVSISGLYLVCARLIRILRHIVISQKERIQCFF